MSNWRKTFATAKSPDADFKRYETADGVSVPNHAKFTGDMFPSASGDPAKVELNTFHSGNALYKKDKKRENKGDEHGSPIASEDAKRDGMSEHDKTYPVTKPKYAWREKFGLTKKSNEYVRCPHCGHEADTDTFEMDDMQNENLLCPMCDKRFATPEGEPFSTDKSLGNPHHVDNAHSICNRSKVITEGPKSNTKSAPTEPRPTTRPGATKGYSRVSSKNKKEAYMNDTAEIPTMHPHDDHAMGRPDEGGDYLCAGYTAQDADNNIPCPSCGYVHYPSQSAEQRQYADQATSPNSRQNGPGAASITAKKRAWRTLLSDLSFKQKPDGSVQIDVSGHPSEPMVQNTITGQPAPSSPAEVQQKDQASGTTTEASKKDKAALRSKESKQAQDLKASVNASKAQTEASSNGGKSVCATGEKEHVFNKVGSFSLVGNECAKDAWIDIKNGDAVLEHYKIAKQGHEYAEVIPVGVWMTKLDEYVAAK
jgi:DNA-directed RNA polymerase subunit RPC12/RpoP